ncbi:MAG: hypothetical protein ACD_2C00201G0004 [uncultured bacterium (gcode 4)]|uniref:Peptidase M23 domain-containing protein n=1 Tax=uncultured bacterium (gcode 4) TaxID=1234023 RepID=K2G4I4_9BACT|nr:MAG: hypothetical protein ACD_2C00201G0004 [uncultured bacterium (gcode 4)]
MKNNISIWAFIAIFFIAGISIFFTLNWSGHSEIKSSVSDSWWTADIKAKTGAIGPVATDDKFPDPITNASKRVTKKFFWIKVSPWHSPISPEKFRWYHTWTDFEITPAENDLPVKVYSICSWPLLMKRLAAWYWGVAVQKCKLTGKVVTVTYWHLKLDSIIPIRKQEMKAWQELWVLWKWFSAETWGERKHLHLGIHFWDSINIKWYVDTKAELEDWMDVSSLLSK